MDKRIFPVNLLTPEGTLTGEKVNVFVVETTAKGNTYYEDEDGNTYVSYQNVQTVGVTPYIAGSDEPVETPDYDGDEETEVPGADPLPEVNASPVSEEFPPAPLADTDDLV